MRQLSIEELGFMALGKPLSKELVVLYKHITREHKWKPNSQTKWQGNKMYGKSHLTLVCIYSCIGLLVPLNVCYESTPNHFAQKKE